ncbi:hypothetical protein AM500_04415 [Bacillus sp. FJAT-18017]|uniref:hypothetical protein n=1 Tax=Bacillus sp. FJAT-18017 TaxID=1705566 RepID=UPI0006ADBD57|nr:hypothetical protein [Bacillus sp. FJAT-18017]ALC89117.1 hypothetical protein AM500_04415 [Bacillus sp. FJAT-18017]
MNNLKKRFDNFVGNEPRFTVSLEDRIVNELSTLDKKKKRPSNLRVSFLVAIFISVAAVFILSMVTDTAKLNQAHPKPDTDSNTTAIQKILELELNGPNEELMDLLWNPKYRTIVNNKEENQELDKYLTEVYGPYFTENGLHTFINAYGGTQYHTFASNAGYILSLKEATIEHNEKIPYRYTFIAKVGYRKNGGEEKIANVEGDVSFSTKTGEEDKITKFQYMNDNGLLNFLSEINN